MASLANNTTGAIYLRLSGSERTIAQLDLARYEQTASSVRDILLLLAERLVRVSFHLSGLALFQSGRARAIEHANVVVVFVLHPSGQLAVGAIGRATLHFRAALSSLACSFARLLEPPTPSA